MTVPALVVCVSALFNTTVSFDGQGVTAEVKSQDGRVLQVLPVDLSIKGKRLQAKGKAKGVKYHLKTDLKDGVGDLSVKIKDLEFETLVDCD